MWVWFCIWLRWEFLWVSKHQNKRKCIRIFQIEFCKLELWKISFPHTNPAGLNHGNLGLYMKISKPLTTFIGWAKKIPASTLNLIYSIHCNSMHCTLGIVLCAFHSMHHILCIVFYALYYMQCILWILFYAYFSMHCTLCFAMTCE